MVNSKQRPSCAHCRCSQQRAPTTTGRCSTVSSWLMTFWMLLMLLVSSKQNCAAGFYPSKMQCNGMWNGCLALSEAPQSHL